VIFGDTWAWGGARFEARSAPPSSQGAAQVAPTGASHICHDKLRAQRSHCSSLHHPHGGALEGYLSQLAEKDASNGVTPRPVTFDEILDPVRQGFAESGMSEAELTALFEDAREEVWQERQAKKPAS
jgi:hypothetical protein